MFCSRCGKQMESDARFCTKCGFELCRAIPTGVKQPLSSSEQKSTCDLSVPRLKKSLLRIRIMIVGAMVAGVICYFIGHSLASDLHRYLNTKGAGIETSQVIVGTIGYIVVAFGVLSVLVGLKALISTIEYPSSETKEEQE